ncbi:MAG TPA: phosphatase PAP2 family protein [Chitinispirillaceae bacterium]|nr:phosphatase PAP2 family protein [Chitinispirillaceae bacterium]
MIDFLITVDKNLFIFFNTWFSSPFLDIFFKTITEPRTWIIPLLITAVLFFFKEKKKAVPILILAVITVAATDLISVRIVKPLIARQRPCHPDILIQGCHYLLGKKRSFSFPSSHATNMYGLAMLFTLFYPKLVIYFMTFASLIGFSRIYCGVHYPGDVLGGFVLGIIIAWLIYNIYFYLQQHFMQKKVLFPKSNKKPQLPDE